MLAIASACSNFEGVAPGYSSELAPSSTGDNNVRIAAGGAMVDGKFYKNTANIDKVIASASAGHYRIDHVVLRATWADFDVTVDVLTNPSEDAPPVALTQTTGVTYEISLCYANVSDAGVMAITDTRKWAVVDTDESTIEDNAGLLRVKALGIGTAQIAADAVTTAKIPNRTRKFFVPCVEAFNTTDGVSIERTTGVGYTTDSADLVSGFGNFVVPQDYVSTMTVVPLWYPVSGAGVGNIYWKQDVQYGAAGEVYNNHETLGVYAATAVAVDTWQAGAASALANAAADDIVVLRFYRDATNVLDTFAGPHYFVGFLVSYTADS